MASLHTAADITDLHAAVRLIVDGHRVDWALAERLVSLHWIIRDPSRDSGYRLTESGEAAAV